MDLTTSFEAAVPADVFVRYEFFETRNAAAILCATNPDAFKEVIEVLRYFDLIDDDLILAGGEESGLAKRLNYAFRNRGWREGRVDTEIKLSLRLIWGDCLSNWHGKDPAWVVGSLFLTSGWWWAAGVSMCRRESL